MKKYKLWERTAFRVTIFLLCGIFAAGAVCLALLGEKRLTDFQIDQSSYISAEDAFFTRDYNGSETFRNSVSNDISTLFYLFYDFTDKDGVRVTDGPGYEREVDELLANAYIQLMYFIEAQKGYGEWDESPGEPYYNQDKDHIYRDNEIFVWWDPWYGQNIEFEIAKIIEAPEFIREGRMKQFDEAGVREAFIAMFPEQNNQIRQMIADKRQERFDYIVTETRGMIYFVSDGERTLSNVELDAEGQPKNPDAFRENPVWVVIERGRLTNSSDAVITHVGLYSGDPGNVSAYIAWTGEAMAAREWFYNEARGIVASHFFTAIALAVLAVVFLVMSIVFTGRKRPAFENTRKLWACDKIFVEAQIVLAFLTALIGGALTVLLISSNRFAVNFDIYILFAFIAGLAFALVFLWFALSLIRVGKAGLLAERSLIAKFIKGPGKAIGSTVKAGYDGSNPLAKTLIAVILLWVFTAIFSGICGIAIGRGYGPAFLACCVLLVFTLFLAIYFTRKWVERYGRLRKGVEELSSGNLEYKIEIDGDGKNEFDRLSALINELGSAQNEAVKNEIKNQRLKTDLISNVSHDLKTPLTSIITYTDLLKKEDLGSEKAKEYLMIIEEKEKRLQKLTEDLFDAAKASSGAIPVKKTKVDLLALIKQEIAEMNGSFDETGLEVVIEAVDEHYYVDADSQLLWRVVDNLLGNAQKYSQPGTRIYIEIKPLESCGYGTCCSPAGMRMTTLEIKNTAREKLNITPEELMERFKRGDEARATEGSGLGLAIAKDLVRLQDGRFDLSIDGDLFKVIVTLHTY